MTSIWNWKKLPVDRLEENSVKDYDIKYFGARITNFLTQDNQVIIFDVLNRLIAACNPVADRVQFSLSEYTKFKPGKLHNFTAFMVFL